MEKNIKNITGKAVKRIIILFALSLVMPGCQDRLNEMNKNPNAITEIPNEFLFTSAVRSTFREQLGRMQLDFGGQYSHQAISRDWNRQIDTYEKDHMQGDVTQEIFRGIYSGAIKYANEVMILTAENGEQPNDVRNALANVVAVMNFAKLTDLFGDIPYFEGGLGKEEVYQPVYDSQKDIYADMTERLKKKLDILKSADFKKGFVGADPIYNNDKDKWLRFINSLRLRLAMRARFADNSYNTVIASCLSENLIETNDQNATLQNWDSENGELYNPWYNYYRDRVESHIYTFNTSEKLVDFLKGSADPRLEVLTVPNDNGEYVGMPNGLIDQYYASYQRNMACMPSLVMLAKDQPNYFMTASEVWFLRAEAALFNIGPAGDANQLYQMGIRKSMEQWKIPLSIISNYLATSAEAKLSGTNEHKFEQIGNQMWVAFAPNYIEAWFNIRRTGYPVIPRRTDPSLAKGVTDGYLPSRLRYPITTERSLNGVNMQKAIDRMGGDNIDTRVWWDVK
jgi:hypothetical protein